MPAIPRRPLLQASLVALLAIDLLALFAFLSDQWVELASWQHWALAAVPVAALLPLLAKVASAVFDAASALDEGLMPGRKIPETGQ